jgi:hypothetical protein
MEDVTWDTIFSHSPAARLKDTQFPEASFLDLRFPSSLHLKQRLTNKLTLRNLNSSLICN